MTGWVVFGVYVLAFVLSFRRQLHRNVNGGLYRADDSTDQAAALLGAMCYAAIWPVTAPFRAMWNTLKHTGNLTTDADKLVEAERKLREAERVIAEFDRTHGGV